MNKKVNVFEGKKRFKGTVELGSSRIILKLNETINIPFSLITYFEDSLTTATEDEFLTGLSFRVKFSGRNLVVMFLGKESEESFTEFVKKIKRKLKFKSDNHNFLGSYYSNVPNGARVFIVILGLVIFGISSLGYKKDVTGTIIGGVIFVLFLIVAIMIKKRQVIMVTENKITRHLLFREDKIVKYSQITKFTRKVNNYGGNTAMIYTLYYDSNKKLSFEHGLIDKSNQLIKFLRQKLRNVPQVDVSSKKEKEWAKGRSY
jgi:hypothetical protein